LISWIVASHHYPTLRDNFGATVRGVDDDEVVVVENPTSIAAAYNEGQARASQPIRVYVHHDVQIRNSRKLRAELVEHCTPAVGIVGVIGSRVKAAPWWDAEAKCGSVVDVRMGLLNFGPGGEAAYLDGLLLATVQTLTWDESHPGFHGYDHDICEQQLANGRPNWCLNNGHELVLHNTVGEWAPDGLDEAMMRFREKWGMDG
jgi:hypothetical protein